MASELVIDGLEELKAELAKLPDQLYDAGSDLVHEYTERTAQQLKANYPEKSGDLRAGVKTRYVENRKGVGIIGYVETWADHAIPWEFGTQDRKTRQGWKRGRSPEHKAAGLVQLAMRNRAEFNVRLFDLVRHSGLDV